MAASVSRMPMAINEKKRMEAASGKRAVISMVSALISIPAHLNVNGVRSFHILCEAMDRK